MYINRTIIVPIELQQFASLLASSLEPEAGQSMFTTLLCNSDNIVTHCVSSGYILDIFEIFLTDATSLCNAIDDVSVTLEMCNILINNSVVATGNPFDVFEEMNLHIYIGDS